MGRVKAKINPLKLEPKKTTEDLTEEELIKIILNQDNKDEIQIKEEIGLTEVYRPDIISFLKEYSIEPGTNAVSVLALHRLYRAWCKSKSNTYAFGNEIKTQFSSDKSGHYVFINKHTVKISENLFETLSKTKRRTLRRPHVKQYNAFIKRFSLIKNDDHWVDINVIYSLYDKWCYKNRSKSQLTLNSFKYYLTGNFKLKEQGNKTYVGVDKSLYQWFTDEQLERLTKGNGYKYKKIKT